MITRSLIWHLGYALTLLLASCGDSGSSGSQSSRSRVGVETITDSTTGINRTQAPSVNCLPLVNGLATREYPAVVRLMGQRAGAVSICTGTFISPTAVLTAAHCIDSSANGGIYLVADERIDFKRNPLANAVAATKAFTQGATGSTGDAKGPSAIRLDTAVVLFPKGLTNTYMGISSKKSRTGTKALSIGYGLTSYYDEAPSPDYDATKHYGYTEVIGEDEDANIYVGAFTATSSEIAPGTRVIESSGDSGGPLIADGMIIGTLSVGGAQLNDNNERAYFSAFVDVTSTATTSLINQANVGGAAIPLPGTLPQILKTTEATTACAK